MSKKIKDIENLMAVFPPKIEDEAEEANKTWFIPPLTTEEEIFYTSKNILSELKEIKEILKNGKV